MHGAPRPRHRLHPVGHAFPRVFVMEHEHAGAGRRRGASGTDGTGGIDGRHQHVGLASELLAHDLAQPRRDHDLPERQSIGFVDVRPGGRGRGSRSAGRGRTSCRTTRRRSPPRAPIARPSWPAARRPRGAARVPAPDPAERAVSEPMKVDVEPRALRHTRAPRCRWGPGSPRRDRSGRAGRRRSGSRARPRRPSRAAEDGDAQRAQIAIETWPVRR